MPVAAYMLGARVIEKHFTLNRAMKGTDHVFSLEPQGCGRWFATCNARGWPSATGPRPYADELAPGDEDEQEDRRRARPPGRAVLGGETSR